MPLTLQHPVAIWLFVLTSVGIVYGSLYPFEFEWGAIPLDVALDELVRDRRSQWSKGNMLANVVLFVPFGLFGTAMLARQRAWRRWAFLIASGAALAFGLQVVQLWLPSRVSDLGDGVLNMLGLAVGAALAHLPWSRLGARQPTARDSLLLLPALLMVCWVAYKWAPFVPSADWQMIKQSLKPLLVEPRLEALNVYRNLVCWLVFASLWRDCMLAQRWLWPAVAGVVLAQIGIVHNALALDSVIGAALAPGIWWLLQRCRARPAAAVLLMLLVLLMVQGLSPFHLHRSQFNWLPFEAFLIGNMFTNLLSLLLKLYLYGALIWLVLRSSERLWLALAIPVLVTALIEIAQTRVAGRVAEITDPLLCVLIWSVLWTSRHRPPAQQLERQACAPQYFEIPSEKPPSTVYKPPVQ